MLINLKQIKYFEQLKPIKYLKKISSFGNLILDPGSSAAYSNASKCILD